MQQIKLCDYGCGKEATHQFKNGKFCCSLDAKSCDAVKIKGKGGNNPLPKSKRENPGLCEYGCGNLALFRFKNGKWCCSESQNSCDMMLKINRKNSTEKNGMKNKKHKTSTLDLMSKTAKEKGFGKWKKNTHPTESTLEKMRNRKATDEQRKQRSETSKGSNNPMFGRNHTEETKEKIRSKKLGKKLHTDIYISEYNLYYKTVQMFTRQSIRKKFTKEELKKRGIAGKDESYNIDHMFSILEGFKNNIPPYIIGHECNLDLIHWKENDSKKTKCSTSFDELWSKIFYQEKQACN